MNLSQTPNFWLVEPWGSRETKIEFSLSEFYEFVCPKGVLRGSCCLYVEHLGRVCMNLLQNQDQDLRHSSVAKAKKKLRFSFAPSLALLLQSVNVSTNPFLSFLEPVQMQTIYNNPCFEKQTCIFLNVNFKFWKKESHNRFLVKWTSVIYFPPVNVYNC